jgi:hypothetical protein
MAVEADLVRRIFAGLEHGDGAAFFEHVADDVDWTLMATHPLAGHYKSKADFTAVTFAKLGKVLPGGAQSAPISTRRWWHACSRRILSSYFPANTGLRLSMKACTASRWSAVFWLRIMRSAS